MTEFNPLFDINWDFCRPIRASAADGLCNCCGVYGSVRKNTYPPIAYERAIQVSVWDKDEAEARQAYENFLIIPDGERELLIEWNGL